MSQAAQETTSRYPPYVTTAEERERWDICRRIAETVSEQNEESGSPSEQFVWYATRQLYSSDMPLGDPAELEGALEEAGDDGDPADELWARVDAGRDEAAEKGGEHLDAYLDDVASLLDQIFGDPDQYDFAEFEGSVPGHGEGHLPDVTEAFADVGAYAERLHPRDRAGKWARKFNAMRAVVAKHGDRVKMNLAATAGAARLKHETTRAHSSGRALHGDVSKAHTRHDDDAARLRAHAAEQRNRQGIRGARQQAIRAKHVTVGHALTTLAYVYSEKAERQLGPFAEVRGSADSAVETMNRVKDSREVAHAAHETARWALEHRTELHQVMHAAVKVAHSVARAKGLAAAADSDDLDADAELVEWGAAVGVDDADDVDLAEALYEPVA